MPSEPDSTLDALKSSTLPKAKPNDATKKAIVELLDLYTKGGQDKQELLDQVEQTSFIKLRGAAIEAKLAPLSMQGDHSRELQRTDDEDIQRVYGKYVSDQMKDPYDFTDKVLQHESYREDGIVASAIDLLIQFIIGDHFKTTIAINEDIDNDDLRQQATKAFNSSPRLRGYKKTIDKKNKTLKITNHLRAVLTQAAIFGRGAWLTEKDPTTKLPTCIKVLPSMTLGRVFVHSKLWSVLGVEYLDFPFPESLLKAEDILYLPIRDYHVSPGAWHYGISLVERIVHISMLNRITNQRNLKEISYRAWAGFLLLELVGNINTETMNEIKDQIANGAGNAIMTNQNVRITSQKFETDIAGMADLRDRNDKEMIRMMQVPEILFDPTTFNRATAQEIMQAWNESVLKAYRSWICDIIEDQWIKPLLIILLENDTRPPTEAESGTQPLNDQSSKTEPPVSLADLDNQFQIKAKQEEDAKNPADVIQQATGQRPELTTPEAQQLLAKEENAPKIDFEALINYVPKDADGNIDIDALPWTIKVDFDPLNFDTFDAKVQAAVNLINAGIIDQIRALKMVGFDEDIQKAVIDQAINKQEQQLRMQVMAENGGNNLQQDGEQGNTNDQQKQGPAANPFQGNRNNQNQNKKVTTKGASVILSEETQKQIAAVKIRFYEEAIEALRSQRKNG